MRAPITPPRADVPPDCTSSPAAPAIDGVLAVAGTIAAIVMIRDVARPRCGAVDINGGTECTWEVPTLIGTGLATVGLGISAYRGVGIYNECNRATLAYGQTATAAKAPAAPSPSGHSYVAPIVVLSILATVAVGVVVGVELSKGFHL